MAAKGKPLSSPISPDFVYKITRAIDRPNPAVPLQDVGSQPNSGVRAMSLWGVAVESEVDGGRTATSPDYGTYLDAHVNDEPKLGDMEFASKRIIAGFNAIVDDDPQKLVKFSQALASGHTIGTGVDAGGDAFQQADGSQPLGYCGNGPITGSTSSTTPSWGSFARTAIFRPAWRPCPIRNAFGISSTRGVSCGRPPR